MTHRHASALIVVGPYRFTRNPVYVGLTALCVGAALVANTSWLTSEPERYAAYTREYLGWGVFALMPRC